MKENSEKEEQKEKEDNTYSREGMCYGVAAGAVIGAIVIAISSTMCLYRYDYRTCYWLKYKKR